MSSPRRPLGVTLVGIFWLIRGVVSVALGALAVAAVAVASIVELAPRLEPLVQIVRSYAGFFGIITVLVGALQLLLAWGLLGGKYWGWLAALVVEVIRVVTSVLTLPRAPLSDLVQVLISAVIIAYLLQPHVRAFFEHTLPPPPAYQPPAQVQTA